MTGQLGAVFCAFILLICEICSTEATFAGACGNRPLVTDLYGSSRIVGGKDTLPGSWPWVVSIQELMTDDSFEQLCGGTILNIQWVLTAAHCFKKQGKAFHNWRVVFGAYQLSDLGSDVQIRGIADKIEHEKYNPYIESNDIALLRLYKPITYSDYIQPACLPKATASIPQMTNCFIAGWGVMDKDSDEPADVLQEAHVKQIPNKICNSRNWYNGQIGVYNLCAGHERGGIDSCQGDSGGPLMCRQPNTKSFSVLGVTSWGSSCGEARRPGVYTSTQYYLNWIIAKLSVKRHKALQI